MTVTRPEHAGTVKLCVRVVVTAHGQAAYPITVDVSDDPNASARLVIGAQQIAVPGRVLEGLYAVLHGIYGAGQLV